MKLPLLPPLALLCSALAFAGIGVYQWREAERKRILLETSTLEYEREVLQVEQLFESKLAETSEKGATLRAQESKKGEERLREAVRAAEAEYDRAAEEVSALGKSPMLDALQERYGDGVTRWTSEKVFVNSGMWESFSYSDGRVVFTFHNKGEGSSALDVKVVFFNQYGLITGMAAYNMSTSIRSLFGFNGTKSMGQVIREVGCPMYLGEPAYYVVSKKDVIR